MERKTAIVTGAGRGIGRAIAIMLAERGHDVVINFAGNEEAARDTAAACEAKGAKTLLAKGSVADAKACAEIVDQTMESFGRIDVLVNNAGITRDAVLMRMSEEDFDSVIATNLKGCYNMMKATSRIMMKQRSGRVINMASIAGITGNAGQVNYSASKAGIIGMTKSYAREVASRGITVNAVAPGFIDTDMTRAMPESAIKETTEMIPMARAGKPEDVAAAAAFFASDEAAYITGQVLTVDGGMCM